MNLQGDVFSSGSMSNCWCDEKCIPHQVSRDDLRSKPTVRDIEERSVHCWGGVRGCNHDS